MPECSSKTQVKLQAVQGNSSRVRVKFEGALLEGANWLLSTSFRDGPNSEKKKPLRITRFSGKHSGKLAKNPSSKKLRFLLQSVLGVQGPCTFEIGPPHFVHLQCWSGASRESPWGCPENFTFHRKIASIFHRRMVCVSLSAAGKLVNIFHRKIFHFPATWFDGFIRKSSHPLRKKETSRGCVHSVAGSRHSHVGKFSGSV